MGSNARTDFECRYIVTNQSLKQFKLIFDKTINTMKKQLKTAYRKG